MKFSRHSFWRWTTSVPVPVHGRTARRATCICQWGHTALALLLAVDRVRACRGRTAQRATHLYCICQWGHTALALLFGGVDRVLAVGALPEELYQFCQWGRTALACSWRWTESVPWAHCPKSCINFCQWGRTALACSWRWTESVPVGALPEELLASAGEGALPWQLRLLVKRNLKRNRPLRRRWLGRIRETWRPDQATPTSKLSKRWAIDPGGCPQWCWRNPFQPFPKISKKRRTSIFLKLDFRVEHNEKAHERWCMRSLSKKKKKGLWNAGLEYMDDGNTLLSSSELRYAMMQVQHHSHNRPFSKLLSGCETGQRFGC